MTIEEAAVEMFKAHEKASQAYFALMDAQSVESIARTKARKARETLEEMQKQEVNALFGKWLEANKVKHE